MMGDTIFLNCGTDSPEIKSIEFVQSMMPPVDNEFDHEVWNSLCFLLVCYADRHGLEFEDKQLPWAEMITIS